MNYDETCERAVDAATFFTFNKGGKKCGSKVQSTENGIVKIVHIDEAKKFPEMDLVCQDFTQKPQSEFKTCNFDVSQPRAVFIKSDADMTKRDDVIHAFTALSEQFGHNSPKEDVFELFGEFSSKEHDVIFDDRAEKFVGLGNDVPTDDFMHGISCP